MLVVSMGATIPPTMIEAGTFVGYPGSVEITSNWNEPYSQTVPYNTAFSQAPTFALLLSGFNLKANGTNTVGYDISYGVVTKSSAQFSISNTGNAVDIVELQFRWVATVGEHLQLFPISYTFTEYISFAHREIPFDYRNKVVWSAGNFEV